MANLQKSTIITPSLLSADPARFKEELLTIEEHGADRHHVDVMDGHFVPNLTFGLPLIAAIKKFSKIPLDVHIMISNPESMAEKYLDAGSDILTFHYEACNHHHRLIRAIQEKGHKAGIALNPSTPISLLKEIIHWVDQITIMSVNPGFGGQSFIEASVDKIKRLSQMLRDAGRYENVDIQVDGGVNDRNAETLRNAGANILVAGSFVYGAKDRKQAIACLR